jgi:Arc/MetJ family transcription regulator
MPTNLALDDGLIAEAVRAGRHKTKREAVTAALQEYVRLKRRLGLLELVNQIEYDPSYDYKDRRRQSAKRLPRNGGPDAPTPRKKRKRSGR